MKPIPLLAIGALAALCTLHLGCSLCHPTFVTTRCTIAVRSVDASGPIGPAIPVYGGPLACTAAPAPEDATARFDGQVATELASLCRDTSPRSAARRALLCPPGTVGHCQVPGSLSCQDITREPSSSGICSIPIPAGIPACAPTTTPPGAPRLCLSPEPPRIDFGEVGVGVTFLATVRIANCGGGRLIAPPPSRVLPTSSPAFGGPGLDPVWNCALTAEEMAAGGAFLGAADRPECLVTLRFKPASPGQHSGVFRYALPGGGAFVDFSLTGRGIPAPAP